MSYLDPSILRLASQPTEPRGERATLHVTSPPWDYEPGQRIQVNTRMATVVSWHRRPRGELVVGDLVVEYDPPAPDPTRGQPPA